MKAVLTVIGVDQVGIIAKVTAVLADFILQWAISYIKPLDFSREILYNKSNNLMIYGIAVKEERNINYEQRKNQPA